MSRHREKNLRLSKCLTFFFVWWHRLTGTDFSQKEEEEISGGVCVKNLKGTRIFYRNFFAKKLFPTGSLSASYWACERVELSFSLMRRSLVYILPCLMWWHRASRRLVLKLSKQFWEEEERNPIPGVCAHETLLGTLPELFLFFPFPNAQLFILYAQFGKTNARRRVWLAGGETSESRRSQR